MLKFPEVTHLRLISLSWIDAQDKAQSVVVCTVKDNEAEGHFRREFEKKGWLYEQVLAEANVNHYTDVYQNLRLTSVPLQLLT